MEVHHTVAYASEDASMDDAASSMGAIGFDCSSHDYWVLREGACPSMVWC